MQCENCGIQINGDFSYSIRNNQCPACGQSIMQQAKMASYLSLCTLLRDNVTGIDAEKIASLIVANFDVRQIFKEGGTVSVTEEVVETRPPLSDTKSVNGSNNIDQLQKMRDEALDDALDAQGDMAFSEGLIKR